MRQRVYYAHPMSWYDTPEEFSDVEAIGNSPDIKVINPNSNTFEDRVKKARTSGYPVMQIFADYIRNDADVVCFRRFKDGKIGAGVAREVFEAIIWGKEVWEIAGPYSDGKHEILKYPDHCLTLETLTVEETKRRVAARQL